MQELPVDLGVSRDGHEIALSHHEVRGLRNQACHSLSTQGVMFDLPHRCRGPAEVEEVISPRFRGVSEQMSCQKQRLELTRVRLTRLAEFLRKRHRLRTFGKPKGLKPRAQRLCGES